MKPEDIEVEVKKKEGISAGYPWDTHPDEVQYSVKYRLKGRRHYFVATMKNCVDELDAYNKFMRMYTKAKP